MVLVPGGTFIMGNDRGELNERPPHTVRVSTFYIDQYEVTNRQFRTFLDETHWTGLPPGKWLTDKKRLEAPESLPANYVDYHDAENFALWAGKRLATEAQWEMAARSGDGRRYPWGDQSIQWSRHREFRQVDPVMSFQEDVSPYGVFDMAGNTTEWVRDWYDPKYFEKQKDKIVENPTGPPNHRGNSIQRVVKGGSKNWIVSARQGFDVRPAAPLPRIPLLAGRGRAGGLGGHQSPSREGQEAQHQLPDPGRGRRANHSVLIGDGLAGRCGAAGDATAPRGLAGRTLPGPVDLRHHVRLVVSEPSNGALDALAITQGRLPAQAGARLLGAVFEVASQQPGAIAGDARRLDLGQEPALHLQQESPGISQPVGDVSRHARDLEARRRRGRGTLAG